MKRVYRNRLILIVLALLALPAIAFVCDCMIEKQAAGKLYDEVSALPAKRTGLLLGTSKYLKDGRSINPYYRNRVDAAGKLLKANKIKYMVISGDNSRKTYNEPEDMRRDLIALGIDSNRLFLDYAGFRTFDSVLRLKSIFSQNDVVIISQKFHNERALYIAGREGINALAFNATDVGKDFGFKVMLREKLARVKVFVDYLLNTKPRFAGPKVAIPA